MSGIKGRVIATIAPLKIAEFLLGLIQKEVNNTVCMFSMFSEDNL